MGPAEKHIIDNVKQARPADYTTQTEKTLKAEFIRNLLFGFISDPTVPFTTVQVTPFGLKIIGAEIEGELNLENFGADSQEPVALAFENCTFREPINLSHAHLKRLSLKKCHLVQLKAAEIQIDGDVNIKKNRSSQRCKEEYTGFNGKGQCGINLIGARIKGNLLANKSKLCAEKKDRPLIQDRHVAEYALNLRGAHVDGLVILQPCFKANGGVSIRDARIKGDLWASGAVLIAQEEYAFNAQSAQVDGHILLRRCKMDNTETNFKRFEAKGCIWMPSVMVGGSVQLSGARISRASNNVDNCTDRSVDLTNARIQGDLKLCSLKNKENSSEFDYLFETAKPVIICGAHIGNTIKLYGSNVNWEGLSPLALNMEHVKVAENINMEEMRACGGIKLNLAKVGGDLLAHSIDFYPSKNKCVDNDCKFKAIGLEVMGDFKVSGKLRIHGIINHATIWGSLHLGTYYTKVQSSQKHPTNQHNPYSPKELKIIKFPYTYQEESDFILMGTTVHGRLKVNVRTFLSECEFNNSSLKTKGKNHNSADDLLCSYRKKLSGINTTESQLLLEKADLYKKGLIGNLDNLLKEMNELFKKLECNKGETDNSDSIVIDLRGLKVTALQDSEGRHWGQHTKLKLSGFDYSYMFFDDETENTLKKSWQLRKEWLGMQFDQREPRHSEYRPQVYSQLSKVYKLQGKFDDADNITVLKLSEERKLSTSSSWRFILYIYEKCFDYGLSPKKSLLTLAGLVLFGWIFFALLNYKGLLVLDTTSSATVAIKSNNAVEGIGFPSSSESDRPEKFILCGDQVNLLVYAFDLILPLLDLRHGIRCDIKAASTAYGNKAKIEMHENIVIADILGWPNFLLVIKAIYTVLGWIVVSITILTVSGILRRAQEG